MILYTLVPFLHDTTHFFGMRPASQSRYLKVFIRGDEKSPILMVRSGHLVPTHRMMMERPI